MTAFGLHAANDVGALSLDVQIGAARDEHVERVLSLRRRLREIGADCGG